MPDFRAYCRSDEPEAQTLRLSAEESHHLVLVNRARAGDRVVAFDGRGREWNTTLLVAEKRAAVLQVHATNRAVSLPYELTLAQALPKGTAMENIVRKATEIGVARVVPLETERTQVHFDGQRSDRKVEKWQTAALEACKQCGNPWLPEIGPVQDLAAWMATLPPDTLRLVASLHPGAGSLRTALQNYQTQHGARPQRVVWLVGPEGDFSPSEMALAQEAGFLPITLGPLVLRCETAAVYALSVISYELQNP